MRHWLIRNHITILIIAALGASYVVSNHDSNERDRAQASQLIDACERSSTRAALIAAYQQDIADNLREDDEIEAARRHEGYMRSSYRLIPTPTGIAPGDPRIIAVAEDREPDGDLIYRLTEDALDLQRAGCRERYS